MEAAPQDDDLLRPPPGTRLDLQADARNLGLDLNARQITEWRRIGLLGAPQRRKSAQHGQDLAEFSAEQRALFRAVVRNRVRGVSNGTLANLPVFAWLHYGDDWARTSQVRLAMRTAVGKDLRRSERAAASAARTLLDMIDVNNASVHARAAFKREVAEEVRGGDASTPPACEHWSRRSFNPVTSSSAAALGTPRWTWM